MKHLSPALPLSPEQQAGKQAKSEALKKLITDCIHASNIFLKLENLQPSGSFKSRGVGNFLLSRLTALKNLPIPQQQQRQAHFYCSSGGNAGLGCVHAAVTLGCAATIVVPLSTTAYTIAKLRQAGANDVLQHGASWVEANAFLTEEVLPAAARERSHDEAIYVPPFDAPEIWAGNATMVAEIARQWDEVGRHYPSSSFSSGSAARQPLDAIVCSVGGGGLFCGIMQGLDELEMKQTQVVAAETQGAESLAKSVEKGEMVTLDAITSIATSLGARKVCEQAFRYGMQRDRVSCVVVSDEATVRACKAFADDERMLVEPACGASLALCYNGGLKKYVKGFSQASNVVIICCGGSNLSLDMMARYVDTYCPEEEVKSQT